MLIVGVGAIGRQVALQMAAMGVGSISLIDHDTVEQANLGPQGYRPSQIGAAKVDATEADILAMNPECEVSAYKQKATAETHFHQFNTVFVCVDCMDARRAIFESESKPDALIDTRMSAMTCQVFYVDEFNRDEYAKTLFGNDQAHPEPCTARSTIFTASIVAGLAVTQWTQSFKHRPLLPFAQLSLNDFVLDPVTFHLQAEEETCLPEDTAQEEPQTEASVPADS